MRLPRCKRTDNDEVAAGLLRQGWREIEEFVTYEREAESLDHEFVSVTNFWEPFVFPFTESRLHRDPEVPDSVADDFKRKCIERASKRKWPLLTHGNMGFLIVRPEEDAMAIDLLGVFPGCRRQGVGSNLVKAFVSQSAGTCRAGTQGHNPACQLYESLGFREVKRERTFHK